MNGQININFKRANQHLEMLDEERHRAERLKDFLLICYFQEQANPIGRPELIQHEIKCMDELIKRISKRYSIVEDLVEGMLRCSWGLSSCLEDARAYLRAYD